MHRRRRSSSSSSSSSQGSCWLRAAGLPSLAVGGLLDKRPDAQAPVLTSKRMSQATRSSMHSPSSRQARVDALLKRPAAMQVAEQGNNSTPGRSTVLLRRSSSGVSDSSSSLVMDNKNPSKLVVKPDGNILWEMPAEPSAVPAVGGALRGALEMALVLSAASSGVMGIAVAVVELKRAAEHNYCVTSQHLAKVMAMTVSSSFAGTVTGLLYAPLLAARILCGRFARPAALAGLAWGATRGVLRMIALRGLNPANLLAQLEDAALSLGMGSLGVVEKVAERAVASPKFRRAFVKMGGVEALLKLLRNGLDGEAVASIMQALASLLQEQPGRDAMLSAGGVPLLVHGLEHADTEVAGHCSEMLARLSSSSAAQAAIREAGGVPLIVQLLSSATSTAPQQQLQLLAVASALAGGSEAGSAALQQAGVAGVLLELVGSSPLPRTQVKEAAISTLHSLCSSSPSHFAALRALPGAAEQLSGVSRAYGRGWFASKAALSALNAQLAAAAEADEEAAAAPIAGEVPELI
ncbi:hypothetical protein OEZ85_002935 [Tetradesmus obliquus]|uniref:Armadillo repeat-containing domain-containing protein n=1 Tax=Tetradesmus obliquus TaxID=3088 RepID=A0ABY8TZ21_TETOB|nr:hypothetical protein OEZ85_002935 [Tetradesmus obliquus]